MGTRSRESVRMLSIGCDTGSSDVLLGLGVMTKKTLCFICKWILGSEGLILGRKLLHTIIPVLISLVKFIIKGNMQLNGIFQ